MIELNLIIDVLSFLKRAPFKNTPILLTHRIHLTKCDHFCEMKGAFSFRGLFLSTEFMEGEKKEVGLNCTERRALDLIKGMLFLMRLLEDGYGFSAGFINHSLADVVRVWERQGEQTLMGQCGGGAP